MLLPNGLVLVGVDPKQSLSQQNELFNPSPAVWTVTGTLNTARNDHTATLLPNGLVLVAGGMEAMAFSNSAELFNSSTGVWTVTGNLTTERYYHTATLLPNGLVLVAGGGGRSSSLSEIYNPSTGVWTATGNLNTARNWHTATLLPSGLVLVAVGRNRWLSRQCRSIQPVNWCVDCDRQSQHSTLWTHCHADVKLERTSNWWIEYQ